MIWRPAPFSLPPGPPPFFFFFFSLPTSEAVLSIFTGSKAVRAPSKGPYLVLS